jgi:hypothetical protein
VLLNNGRTAIVLGRGGQINPGLVRGGVAEMIAHSHRHGLLIPSGNNILGQGGDLYGWAIRGQTHAYILGPDGNAVMWMSQSGQWMNDITFQILAPLIR